MTDTSQSTILNDDLEWTKTPTAVLKMKQVLWALEALSRMRDALGKSLSTVDEAVAVLEAQVEEVRSSRPHSGQNLSTCQVNLDQGPGKRSKTLERMCIDCIDQFGKKLGILRKTFAEVEHRIELIGRYRDSVSSPR